VVHFWRVTHRFLRGVVGLSRQTAFVHRDSHLLVSDALSAKIGRPHLVTDKHVQL